MAVILGPCTITVLLWRMREKANGSHRLPAPRVWALASHRVRGMRAISADSGHCATPSQLHLLEAGVEMNVIRGWLGHVSLETTVSRRPPHDLAASSENQWKLT
jgi:hypothetical protein